MRDATFYANSLLELHKVTDAAARRASWRQALASLGRAVDEDGPGPLEGLNPEALLKGVRAALQLGLADDLDWLAPAAAGSALYELASALPVGPEQRELGRRVLARLVAADAQTFAAIARRMALGAGKGFSSPVIRARVALLTELPIGLGVDDGPLALAIASRRELARDWIATPSTGSLPSRRLAARLIERAAREAAKKTARGDDHSLRVFKSDAIRQAWDRLLSDRESLVWRHIAVARGLLAPWMPHLAQTIEDAFAASFSPTEWRRGAASVAAYAAVAPDLALSVAERALSKGLLTRDPGAASAFLWGLPRAAELEPEAAARLLDLVMERAPAEIGEAVVELCSELGDSALTEDASTRALARLADRSKAPADDGADALAREVSRDLERTSRQDQPLRHRIAVALQAFATEGAKEAHALARDVLAAAQGSLFALEAIRKPEEGDAGRAGVAARRTSLAHLRDLDVSLLERDVLVHLLALGGGGDAAKNAEQALDPLRDGLAEWILARETAPLDQGVSHLTLTLRRLRTLLHLVDSDMGSDDSARQAVRLRVARALVERFEKDPPSPVRRTVIAAAARALDALVRVGPFDVVDSLLVVTRTVSDASSLATLAEASMDPDLVHMLDHYARFAVAVSANAGRALPAFEALTRDIAPDASGRIEALRTALVRLGAALAALSAATALRDLAPQTGGEPEAVTGLENALVSLAHLAVGARRRLEPEGAASPAVVTHGRPLTLAVERVLSGTEPALSPSTMDAALRDILSGVPAAIAKLVEAQLGRLVDLPVDGIRPLARSSLRPPEALPAWLPARRTLGGFYVVRSLGAGGGGSVFVATRVEDKTDPEAERLALKVPEYSASAARALSEAEFLKMFREEASALIALPAHPNLARFVTFDAGTKPKPILVMELVEGVTLERLLEAGGVDTARALRVLDNVLAGLEAMHAAGVAHLDVKPSNVVLRAGEEGVLVDFGLAGRHIRPGCATGAYGAPEVWGALELPDPSPAKADIYAFGCVAFETLTARELFQADSEVSQIAMHVSHDGSPPRLAEMGKRPGLAALGTLLSSTLRRDPAKRPSATALRRELAKLASTVAALPWPLAAPA